MTAIKIQHHRETDGAPPFLPTRIEFPDERLTLRKLIAQTVDEELRLADSSPARRGEIDTFRRGWLTASEIGRMAASGKIAHCPPRPLPPLEVAVTSAIEAFENGDFFVLLDNSPLSELDTLLDFEQQVCLVFLHRLKTFWDLLTG